MSSGRGLASSSTTASALLSGASTSKPASTWNPRGVVIAARSPGTARPGRRQCLEHDVTGQARLVEHGARRDLAHRGAVGSDDELADRQLAHERQHVRQRTAGHQGDVPPGTVGGAQRVPGARREHAVGRQQRAVHVEREQRPPRGTAAGVMPGASRGPASDRRSRDERGGRRSPRQREVSSLRCRRHTSRRRFSTSTAVWAWRGSCNLAQGRGHCVLWRNGEHGERRVGLRTPGIGWTQI